MLAVTISLATVELGWLIIVDIIRPPIVLLEIHELLNIFGLILLVVLGLELLTTLKAYLIEKKIHFDLVFIVALIAVGRKIIVLDIDKISSLTLIGIASIVIALSAGYFLVKRSSSDRQLSNTEQ